jgi:hypothetical protein
MSGIAAAGAFGPDTLEAMGTALDLAWSFVQRSSDAPVRAAESVREILARNVIKSAQFGARTKLQMASYAIGRLRAQLGDSE